MNRGIFAIMGWVAIAIGIGILFLHSPILGLIIIFVGAFLRLIYNSEKYKFFKYIHLELFREYGSCAIQAYAQRRCLWGFYRGVIDFAAVVILPFFIIPALDLPWYCESIISLVYCFMLRPIFKPLGPQDIELANHIISQITTNNNISSPEIE